MMEALGHPVSALTSGELETEDIKLAQTTGKGWRLKVNHVGST